MGEPMFRFSFDDGEYDLTRVTRSELSHFKQWYGPDYGEKLTITIKAIRRDADALACLMWACRREHGLMPNPDPRNMPDFDPDDILAVVAEEDLELAPVVPLDNGAKPSQSTETNGPDGSTTATPTDSGGPGLPSSDTSAT